ncbi:hypothetical protein ACIQAL_03640 [Pseudomonas sp. NPDC088368]|uniref:hypothetical protein n=1 Tax=Pseudomonas sp. NPDC088368 TaxID=3364453 RepID=UPI00382EE869
MSNPSQALPPVPTTKILAVGRFLTPPTFETIKSLMPQEVSETAQLYLDGKIEQWFSRQDESGVVFLLNVVDLEEAHHLLDILPLGRAGLMVFDLIPLGPLKPLRFLLKPT